MAWTTQQIPDLSGQVAIVTGGNGGLGLDTVHALVDHRAHVIIGARNLEKAAAAEQSIRANAPDASLTVLELDLASVSSIRAFATQVLEDHATIDLLFNNAGMMATPEWTTEEGFEMQFGVNHLGHFELTRLLLPALERAPAARVVMTSSSARFGAGKYDLDNPHHRGDYDPWEAYGYSKLANLQFAIELNRRLEAEGSKTTAYAADPGLAQSGLQQTTAKNLPGAMQSFWVTMVNLVGQSSAAGALNQLRAGTDPEAVGGSLYRPRWMLRGAPVVGGVGKSLRKEEDLAKLWKVSERELDVNFDVAEIVRAVRAEAGA